MELNNVGKAFTWTLMGAEGIQAIQDLRWMIVCCIVLIICDFRFGRAESKKRHKEAIEAGDKTLAQMTEFHFSRALRRTCNKFVDYMSLLLVFCLIGLAITEPFGLCDHNITAGFAVFIACVCELASIGGHFLYLKGIEKPKLSWKSILLFLGRVAASFAKTKDPDLGEALDESIRQSFRDEKAEGSDWAKDEQVNKARERAGYEEE